MRHVGSFLLRIPDEADIFYRAAGVMETNSYDSNLAIIRKKPQFGRLGTWDKGLYLNGILELFGGLQSASRFFEHSYWRGIFERLSMGLPEKETGLFERVKNSLEKKRLLITSQLASGHSKPIDWLSHLVIRHARELQLRQEEISFSELEVAFPTARAVHYRESGLQDWNNTCRNRSGPEGCHGRFAPCSPVANRRRCSPAGGSRSLP